MESSKKSNRKWIIFGTIIAVLALLVAIGPVLVTKYMRNKYMKNNSNGVRSELMIKVKGVIKQSSDEKTIYLAGENGLFYVLFGEQTDDLLKNVNQTATVFGNMYEPVKDEQIEGNPVRLRINVVNAGYPDLESLQK
jgi:hypothetical protein